MDLTTFRELLAPHGRAALAAATALAPTDAGFLASVEHLRKHHPAALAKAALETAILRTKATAKFAYAERMFFTRESLEQASGDAAARHRALRFRQFERVLDLCCGIGADALQLAEVGLRVEAVEADPLRLAMAQANAAALGFADRIRFQLGDVRTMPLSPADAAFVDPARRDGEARHLNPERYSPPLSAVRARFPPGFPLAAKIAPGTAWSDLDADDAEVEFVSVDGELKECVLWFGPLRSASRRATVLPSGATLHATGTERALLPAPPAGFIFDPDPAVIRAGLVGVLAEQLGAVPVDHGIAVLAGPAPAASPFARGFAIEHAAPFHLGKLREYLRERSVGRVTLLKRAVELDVNDVQRKLKLNGSHHRTVMLVRAMGKPWAVVCSEQSPPVATGGLIGQFSS